MQITAPARRMVLTGVVAALVLAGCGDDGGSSAPEPSGSASTDASSSAPTSEPGKPGKPDKPDKTGKPTKPPKTPKPSPTGATEPPEPTAYEHVLVISVDGLNPTALEQLGPAGAPAIWSLLENGTGTLDARTEVELTDTLPNHVGMATGRPIAPFAGGHGVTWNDDRPGDTVQAAAGGPVESMFTVVARSGGSSAVFAQKSKFNIFEDSWPDAVDVTIGDVMDQVSKDAAADLRQQRRALTFVHLADPDKAGHTKKWLSPAYLDAVRAADGDVGRLLDTVRNTPALRDTTLVVLTADHGGIPRTTNHRRPEDPSNFTIPFVIAGSGVPAGDLYALAPAITEPGDAQPPWSSPDQPIRNCDVANVATLALGLDLVPGSVCVSALELPLS